MNDLTQEQLKSKLDYNPNTGIFTWNRKGIGIAIGKVAGTLLSGGYIHIGLNNKQYLAHRLAVLYMTGKFPREVTDHINHNKRDNRWENIRTCTHVQNMQNTKITARNTSGYKGVSWHKSSKKWRACIRVNKKSIEIGYFDCKKEAAKAYNEYAMNSFGAFHCVNKID